MFLSSGSPGLILFWMPSSPAMSSAAKARDGVADGGAAVAGTVSEVDRRFVTRHEAFVTVRGGVANGAQGLGVLEQTAGVIERHLAEAAVFLAGKERLALAPQ